MCGVVKSWCRWRMSDRVKQRRRGRRKEMTWGHCESLPHYRRQSEKSSLCGRERIITDAWMCRGKQGAEHSSARSYHALTHTKTHTQQSIVNSMHTDWAATQVMKQDRWVLSPFSFLFFSMFCAFSVKIPCPLHFNFIVVILLEMQINLTIIL